MVPYFLQSSFVKKHFYKNYHNSNFHTALANTLLDGMFMPVKNSLRQLLNDNTVAILTAAAIGTLLCFSSVWAKPGDLDPTWGAPSGAIVSDLIRSPKASSILVQEDGKVVIGGSCAGRPLSGSGQVACLVRHNSNGTIDTSFGINGVVVTAALGQTWYETAALLQFDGKILVVSNCSLRRFCVGRFNADGSIDVSYGGASTGYVLLELSVELENGSAKSLLQSDGKLLIIANIASQNTTLVTRLNANGTYDAAFGQITFPAKSFGIAMSGNGFVLAAACDNTTEACLVKRQLNGAADTSFGNSGFVRYSVNGARLFADTIVIRPDGRIVVTSTGATSPMSSFAFLPNGTLDTSYGQQGLASASPTGVSRVTHIRTVLQPDGRLVITAYCIGTNGYANCVARFNANGTFDVSFGLRYPLIESGGGSRSGTPGFTDVLGLTIQPFDGKLLFADSANNEYSVARTSGGPVYPSCTQDIDGDGQTTATRDGLILTRIMLGMREAAVLSGINLSGAVRNDWTKIKNYLVDHCAMTIN
ncbi:MAG: hypothetical protein ACRCWJ_21645 [Casimicrobium sp.]